MKKSLIPIIVAAIVIAGIFIIAKVNSSPKVQVADGSNVSIVDGKQIVTINVKGGYQPINSVAQADIPTVIRFVTKGTFDCSSSIRISSLNVSKVLPQTGSTDIDGGIPQVGVLQGMCGMGMYQFTISFQ